MLSLNGRTIHYSELRVVGSSDSTPKQVSTAVELISQHRIPVDKMVTHVLDLGQIIKTYELMQSGESLRVVLKP